LNEIDISCGAIDPPSWELNEENEDKTKEWILMNYNFDGKDNLDDKI
jgi:hypothetical protein